MVTLPDDSIDIPTTTYPTALVASAIQPIGLRAAICWRNSDLPLLETFYRFRSSFDHLLHTALQVLRGAFSDRTLLFAAAALATVAALLVLAIRRESISRSASRDRISSSCL